MSDYGQRREEDPLFIRYSPFDIRHSAFAILACCTLIVVIGAGTAAVAAEFQAVRIDGTRFSGVWIASSDGSSVGLRTGDGLQIVPFDELSSVTFHAGRSQPTEEAASKGQPPTQDRSATPVPVIFHLADGGRLYGELVGPGEQIDAVVGRTVLGNAVTFPFDRLAGVQLAGGEQFPRAEELFRSALAARLPGHDVLITRSVDEVKTLRGRLEELSPQRGSFVFRGRTRTFQAERIFGVVFASGPGVARLRAATVGGATALRAVPRSTADTAVGPRSSWEDPRRLKPAARQEAAWVTVAHVDGSVFSGWIERADAYSLQIAASVGFSAELPLAEIASIRVHSNRVVYLSDLTPAGERVEGLLHRPWPVRLDRCVSGGPMSIGGRSFERGLGVHSRTQLTFEIEGAYEKFAATIGIDDSVRPRGSVVFRVLGDTEALFDSGVMTGADALREVIVDVSSVSSLTLVVDYGDELDLADHADWGGARLLKPAVANPGPDTH